MYRDKARQDAQANNNCLVKVYAGEFGCVEDFECYSIGDAERFIELTLDTDESPSELSFRLFDNYGDEIEINIVWKPEIEYV